MVTGHRISHRDRSEWWRDRVEQAASGRAAGAEPFNMYSMFGPLANYYDINYIKTRLRAYNQLCFAELGVLCYSLSEDCVTPLIYPLAGNWSQSASTCVRCSVHEYWFHLYLVRFHAPSFSQRAPTIFST